MNGNGGAESEILVVAPHMPTFDRAAGSLRLYLMLKILARTYRVEFLGLMDVSGRGSPRYVRALEETGIRVYAGRNVDVVEKAGPVGLCVLYEFFATAEQVLGRVRMRRPDLPVVVDSVDVHYVRELRAAKYSKRPWLARLRAARTRRRELRVYAQADLILAVGEADRAHILEALPSARVVVIPLIHAVREGAPVFEERQRNSMMFVGGFEHRPNVDAMLFFCREVFPLVRQTLPNAFLTIVGDRPPREILDLAGNGIIVTGWVPEVGPYLDSHCVGIAPLRFGAGMKGKVAEALAAGLPMITTTVGAEGMELEDGTTAMIANSPEEFANAVVRVCSDPALHRRLSEAGRAHVRQRWDPAPVERELVAAVEGLRGLRPKPMSLRDWTGALAREAYVRSGMGLYAARVWSMATWYASRISRALRKQ